MKTYNRSRVSRLIGDNEHAFKFTPFTRDDVADFKSLDSYRYLPVIHSFGLTVAIPIFSMNGNRLFLDSETSSAIFGVAISKSFLLKFKAFTKVEFARLAHAQWAAFPSYEIYDILTSVSEGRTVSIINRRVILGITEQHLQICRCTLSPQRSVSLHPLIDVYIDDQKKTLDYSVSFAANLKDIDIIAVDILKNPVFDDYDVNFGYVDGQDEPDINWNSVVQSYKRLDTSIKGGVHVHNNTRNDVVGNLLTKSELKNSL